MLRVENGLEIKKKIVFNSLWDDAGVLQADLKIIQRYDKF